MELLDSKVTSVVDACPSAGWPEVLGLAARAAS